MQVPDEDLCTSAANAKSNFVACLFLCECQDLTNGQLSPNLSCLVPDNFQACLPEEHQDRTKCNVYMITMATYLKLFFHQNTLALHVRQQILELMTRLNDKQTNKQKTLTPAGQQDWRALQITNDISPLCVVAVPNTHHYMVNGLNPGVSVVCLV